MSKLKEADIEVLRTLRDAGWTYSKIAKYFNVSEQTVSNRYKAKIPCKNKYYKSPYRPRSIDTIVSKRDTLKKEYADGKTVKELAYNENCTAPYMYRILKDYSSTQKTLRIPTVNLAEIHQDGRRKLTINEIEEIKSKYENGQSQRELAKEYSVSISTINYHVDPERKKKVNDYSKVWGALNISTERKRERAKQSYIKRRNIIAQMSPEEKEKYLKVRVYTYER